MGFGAPNFNGGEVAPQILDPIFKITPIADLVSLKGSLLVAPSRRSFGERKKKKKKETSAVKYNTSGHCRGRRYNKGFQVHPVLMIGLMENVSHNLPVQFKLHA